MAYDDIATDKQNWARGKVYNAYDYQNIYPGSSRIQFYIFLSFNYCRYKGNDVTPEKMLAVLSGNGKARDVVINSTKDDDIFLFFSDHGSPGILSFSQV
jgi:legumain